MFSSFKHILNFTFTVITLFQEESHFTSCFVRSRCPECPHNCEITLLPTLFCEHIALIRVFSFLEFRHIGRTESKKIRLCKNTDFSALGSAESEREREREIRHKMTAIILRKLHR